MKRNSLCQDLIFISDLLVGIGLSFRMSDSFVIIVLIIWQHLSCFFFLFQAEGCDTFTHHFVVASHSFTSAKYFSS